MQKIGIHLLNIQMSHILTVHQFPLIHKDPFDRLLLAQAKVEKLKFLTADNTILKYPENFIIDIC